jgi:hypothetical protein
MSTRPSFTLETEEEYQTIDPVTRDEVFELRRQMVRLAQDNNLRPESRRRLHHRGNPLRSLIPLEPSLSRHLRPG